MNDATQLEESLQRDIDLIRSKVERMAELAEAGLRDGRKALFEANGQLAYSVILRDKEVDELEKEIDRLCLFLFWSFLEKLAMIQFFLRTVWIFQISC